MLYYTCAKALWLARATVSHSTLTTEHWALQAAIVACVKCSTCERKFTNMYRVVYPSCTGCYQTAYRSGVAFGLAVPSYKPTAFRGGYLTLLFCPQCVSSLPSCAQYLPLWWPRTRHSHAWLSFPATRFLHTSKCHRLESQRSHAVS
jgi:hypothetical protein